jgi:hypothetical protein
MEADAATSRQKLQHFNADGILAKDRLSACGFDVQSQSFFPHPVRGVAIARISPQNIRDHPYFSWTPFLEVRCFSRIP